jgi:GNAT superfamily N-acetyltransferase
MDVKTAATKEDLDRCRPALLAFRTHLEADKYADTMQEVTAGGYQLAFISDDDGNAAGIVGYRFINMLRTGKTIYIDDLFVLPAYRGKGYASLLLQHIRQIAADNQIKQVHLDSGYQLHPAHRLYLNHGFVLNCLHFAYSV